MAPVAPPLDTPLIYPILDNYRGGGGAKLYTYYNHAYECMPCGSGRPSLSVCHHTSLSYLLLLFFFYLCLVTFDRLMTHLSYKWRS
jgi:hypothetical protein